MRILLLGGTGAIGGHLSELLVNCGSEVVVTTRKERKGREGISYVMGDAHDPLFLGEVLSKGWDAVIDFMLWSSCAFERVCSQLLSSCEHYIFLSSYRVFADSPLITERSPRLLDVVEDREYLATDEYALAKARQEDILRRSGRINWTIVRPAITYSQGRFQLCTLECDTWFPLALSGHVVPLSEDMLAKTTTMTWGGDVAKMISLLIGRDDAKGEDFNVCTSKSARWNDVLEIYRAIIPFCVKRIPEGLYERTVGGVYQCRYDRLFNRVVDNSKIITFTGLRESDLLSIDEGIGREFSGFVRGECFQISLGRRLGRLDRVGGCFFFPKTVRAFEGFTFQRYLKYVYGKMIG